MEGLCKTAQSHILAGRLCLRFAIDTLVGASGGAVQGYLASPSSGVFASFTQFRAYPEQLCRMFRLSGLAALSVMVSRISPSSRVVSASVRILYAV